MELGSTAADAESKGSSPGAHRRSPWWAALAVAVTVALVVQAGVDGTAAATRAVMYGGVLAACGVTLFQILAHDGRGTAAERNRLQSIVLIGAASAVAATVIGLLLQVATVSGRGWFGLFDGDAADIVFGSSAHLGAGQ